MKRLVPRCGSGKRHAWTPEQVYGHGGGLRICRTCERCGMTRIHGTWETNPRNGQPMVRRWYRDAEGIEVQA